MEKPLILLVEDEALLAEALGAQLEDAGFSVVSVLDGRAALTELDNDASRFSGLVTDIRLPAMDGWAIARHARELVPTLPIVYASGDSAADWHAKGVPDSIMLAKPFAGAQLVAAIAGLMNRLPPAEQATPPIPS